jgi:hypothetical protein
VFTRNTVPEYGPALPSPAVFVDARELRRFLLVKRESGPDLLPLCLCVFVCVCVCVCVRA